MSDRSVKRSLLVILLVLLGSFVWGGALDSVNTADGGMLNQTVTAETSQVSVPSVTGTILPSLSRVIISLLVIVVMIYLCVFLMRRLSGGRINGNRGKTVRVLEQTYIAPKKSVCLLKLADRLVLIGVTEAGISLLTEMDYNSLPSEYLMKNAVATEGFSGFLNGAIGKLLGGKAHHDAGERRDA